jgi:cobalt/nickel transport system permease protein
MGFFGNSHERFDTIWSATSGSEPPAASASGLRLMSPGTRLLLLLIVLIASALSHTLPALAALIVLTVVAGFLSALPMRVILFRTLMISSMFAIPLALPATLQIFSPGPTVMQIGLVAISETGVYFASRLYLRSLLSLLCVFTLLHSGGVLGIEQGLRQLRVSPTIVTVFRLLWLNVLNFARVAKSMFMARVARTQHPVPLRQAHSMIANQAAMLLALTIHRQQRSSMAMTARGFTGQFPATGFHPPARFSRMDQSYLLGMTLLAAAIARFL